MKRDIDEHCEHAFRPTKHSVAAMFAKNQALQSNAQKLREKTKKNSFETQIFKKKNVFASATDFGAILVDF